MPCHQGEIVVTNSATLIQHLSPALNRNVSINDTVAEAAELPKNIDKTVEDAPKEIAKTMEWKQRFARLQGGAGGGDASMTFVTAEALAGLSSNLLVCGACVGLFSLLRRRYPLVANLSTSCENTGNYRNLMTFAIL